MIIPLTMDPRIIQWQMNSQTLQMLRIFQKDQHLVKQIARTLNIIENQLKLSMAKIKFFQLKVMLKV